MLVAFGGNNTSGPIDVATACNAHGGPHGRLDFETETFIAHTLRGEGFDASEDGSGRGTPLVPVAFTCKDHGGDASDLAPTLRAMGHDGSHANAGGQVAVAFAMRGRDGGAMPEISGEHVSALRAASGGSSRDYVAFAPQAGGKQTTLGYDPNLETVQTLAAKQQPAIAGGSAVRRLTPRECERLQGFPDDYTLIPVPKRNRHGNITRTPMAADGPRYKALGNSMAVPVMRWIGERIAAVDALQLEEVA